ncbi:MAG: AlkZ family DNA glycosylase [Nitrospirae bacterium]|nr:AlkZ family DNA glycosylase [Nitrospirota bacterium]
MTKIAHYRLYNQLIASSRFKKPGEVVASLGAMQAQDYPGTLWAIGLRLPDAVLSDVEKAVCDGSIVRTWPMRGTLHFVAAGDIRWMLELLSPRIISGSASRYKQLELDEATFTRCHKVFEKAMAEGRRLTRDETFKALQHAGIPVDKQRGYHILRRAGQEKIICFGPPRGKQDTFTLLDEWVPASRKLSGDAALAELAKRYFTGHGPATLDDFVWWSGLKVSDARAGLETVKEELEHEKIYGRIYWLPKDMPALNLDAKSVYLLPGFDEYLLGYRDRGAALDPKHAQKICPGNNGMFAPTIVIDGRVVGTWKRTIGKRKVQIATDTFEAGCRLAESFKEAAERYGRFVNLPVYMNARSVDGQDP